MQKINNQVFVVYDGDCPICHHLITTTRLKDSDIELHLIDARINNVYEMDWFPAHISIHNDMVVKVGDQVFTGAEGLHALSLMASGSKWLNRITFAVFSNKRLAKILYPILRWMRMLLLKILKIKPLN